jgi:hypothetical protein
MGGITDKEGRLICDDPQEIEDLLVRFWKESFQISDKLSDGCVLNAAASLEALQQFCSKRKAEHASLAQDAPCGNLVRMMRRGGVRSDGLGSACARLCLCRNGPSRYARQAATANGRRHRWHAGEGHQSASTAPRGQRRATRV